MATKYNTTKALGNNGVLKELKMDEMISLV